MMDGYALRSADAPEAVRVVYEVAAGNAPSTHPIGRGEAAEHLYASMGWSRAGEVPNYALDPFGRPCTTVFFYKQF